MAKIAVICNQKGGVDKTVTVGVGLAREGKRTISQSKGLKQLSFRAPGQERFIGSCRLGANYTKETLREHSTTRR